MMGSEKDRWMRVDQTADRLNISARTVYRLCQKGYLKAFRLSTNGSALRISEKSLDLYIMARVELFRRDEGIFEDISDICDS